MPTSTLSKMSQETYFRLRKLARVMMHRERNVTLSPTALLHEALLRLAKTPEGSDNAENAGRILPLIMRHILVDYARRRTLFAEADGVRSTGPVAECRAVDRLAVKQAMHKLALMDKRQAIIVELKILGGLGMGEIGEQLGCSVRTVRREWTTAQLWLRRELRERNE